MIIDLFTQIWSSPDQLGPEMAELYRNRQSERWGQFDGSTAAHEREMNCVDAALVFGIRADRLGAHVPNEFIADYVARDPQNRAGVAGIDPLSDDAHQQINAAIEMGFVGVTVSPACQGFHPAHSDAMAVYEQCVEASLPIFVTLGDLLPASAMLEFGRPSLWDEVFRAYPNLTVVFNQIGYPWMDETMLLLGKHPRVFADISGVASRPWQLYNALLNASGLRVMDKLVFGSGFPRDTPTKVIETLYTINGYSHGTQLPAIPRSHLRSIIERDAFACLGIESDAIRTGGAAPVSIPEHVKSPPDAETNEPAHSGTESRS